MKLNELKKMLFNEVMPDIFAIIMAETERDLKAALATLCKDSVDLLAGMEVKDND